MKQQIDKCMANPILLIIAIVVALIAAFKKMAGAAADFRKEMGMSGKHMKDLENNINKAAGNLAQFGVSLEDAYEIGKSLSDSMGGVNNVSSELIEKVGIMGKGLGISGSEAADLYNEFEKITGSTEGATENLLMGVKALSQQAGVAPGKVMKDIADNAEFAAKYMKDGGENIAEAAVAAAKLGMTLSEVAEITEHLTDFESSIKSEMQASVLLGRQVNMQAARQLALEGDIAGMMKEITKQVGSQAEWEKMNFVQREAMAKAVGLTVSDMGKMISKQENLSKLQSGQLSMQQAMAKGLTFKEVMDARGVTDPFEDIIASLKSIGFNLMQAFRPLLNIVSPVLKLISKILGFIGKLLNTKIGKGIIYAATAMLLLGKRTRAWIKDMATKGVKSVVGVGKGIASKAKAGIGKILPSKKTPSLPGKQKGGMLEGLFGKKSKINWNDALKGAAALLIISAALWVTAKALQEFGKVSVGGMVKAGIALIGLVGALWIISKIPTSGILKGAAAIFVLGAALIPFTLAMKLLENIPISLLFLIGPALLVFGLSVAAFGYILMAIWPAFVVGIAALTSLGQALIILGLGIVVIGAGLWLLSTGLQSVAEAISPEIIGGLIVGFIGLGIAFGILSIASLLLIPAIPIIAAFGISLLILGVAAIIAGAGLWLIAKAFQIIMECMDLGKVLAMIPALFLLGIALIAFSIAALIAFIPLALLAIPLLVVSVAIGILAKSLEILQEVDVDALISCAGAIAIFFLALMPLIIFAPFVLVVAAVLAVLGIAMLSLGAGVTLAAIGFQALGIVLKDLVKNVEPKKIALVATGLGLFGIGLLTLAYSAIIAAPLLIILSGALIIFGFALSILAPIIQIFGALLPSITESLVKISEIGPNLLAAGVGLSLFGIGLIICAAAIGIFFLALTPLFFVIPFMLLVATALATLGAVMLTLGAGVTLAVAGFQIFGMALKNLIKNIEPEKITLVAIGLGTLGIGLLTLAYSAIIAVPSLIILSGALIIFSFALSVLAPIIKVVGSLFPLITESLIKISEIGPNLLTAGAGLSLFGIGLVSISIGAIALFGVLPILTISLSIFSKLIEKIAPIIPYLDTLANKFKEFAKIGPGLIMSAIGINSLSFAIASFGIGSVAAGIGSLVGNLLGGDPLKKFKQFAEIGAPLKVTAEAITILNNEINKIKDLGSVAEQINILTAAFDKLSFSLMKLSLAGPAIALLEKIGIVSNIPKVEKTPEIEIPSPTGKEFEEKISKTTLAKETEKETEKEKKQEKIDETNKIIDKLDELKKAILSKDTTIEMDGMRVGKTIAKLFGMGGY